MSSEILKKQTVVSKRSRFRAEIDALISKKAAKTLGISFRSKSRLAAALVHPSYRNESPCPKLENFDRLEFFGDSILNFVICRKLYALFPDGDEGLLSKLRSILVSRKILARIAREHHLPGLIKIGKSLKTQIGSSRDKILADALEALLGALYFDGGLAKVERFILKGFAPYFDSKRLVRLDPNPKSTLQELAQKVWKKLPFYQSEPVPEGTKTVVQINRHKAWAVARTRRESETGAARLLLRKIRQDLGCLPKKSSSGRKSRKIF